MNKFLFLSPIVSTVFLVGCATSSPIERYSESESSFNNPPELISNDFSDRDIYRIYHRAATGFVSIQSIRQAAEQRAEDFARRQGKTIMVLGERISEPPYILGNFPRIEIIFALADKNDSSASTQIRSKYDDLERIKTLLDQGAITQEEFEREKKKILSR